MGIAGRRRAGVKELGRCQLEQQLRLLDGYLQPLNEIGRPPSG